MRALIAKAKLFIVCYIFIKRHTKEVPVYSNGFLRMESTTVSTSFLALQGIVEKWM